MLSSQSNLPETLLKELNELEGEEGSTPAVIAPIIFKLTSEDCGERLDKIVAKHVPQFSRNRIKEWIVEGRVTVDGGVMSHKASVYGYETIVVSPKEQEDQAVYMSENIPLKIVYEDDAILVINKPAGLVVHPAAGNWSGTLQNGLLYHYPFLAGVPRAGIVHRLDKDTSGLMVVAKTLVAQTDLVRQLQARTVKRHYLALVSGTIKPMGKVDAPMARHLRDRTKMAVSQSMHAKPAVTHFTRLAQGQLGKNPVSLVQCRLETGRTHQIRVHMLSISHPLVGDMVYGKTHLRSFFPYQALLAQSLGLIHPVSKEIMEWEITLPENFKALLVEAGITYKISEDV